MFKTSRLLEQEPKRGFPAYVVFLCLLTAVYLAIEVPFATFLVEVMGGNPTADEIHRVEHAGRLISGFAVALAYWSFQIPGALKRNKATWRIVIGCVFSAGLLVPAVYFGEKALVDHIATTATPGDRQQAARLVAAREALFHPQGMEGIADTSVHTDGTWNAFRSLFGFMAFFDRDVLNRIPQDSDAIDLAIARSIPNETDFRTDIVSPLLDSYEERYEAYLQISEAHDDALASMYRRIDEAWGDHTRYLQRVGPNRARQEVIRRGVGVPRNWDPYDKRTFVNAIAADRLPDIDSRYQDGIERLFGDGAHVSPGKNSLTAFMSSDQVQFLIAKDLALSSPVPFAVVRGMSVSNELRLYRMHRDGFMNDLKAAYGGDHMLFARNERFGQVGEEAVRSVVAPVLALTLSILGAFGHLFKLANYLLLLALHMRRSRIGLTRLLRDHGLVRVPLLGAVTIYAATTAYAPATEVIGTELYRRSADAWTARTGGSVTRGLEWTISVQPWITPVSDVLESAGLFAPVEVYLASGDIALPDFGAALPDVIEMPPSPATAVLMVDGVETTIRLPMPRPDI